MTQHDYDQKPNITVVGVGGAGGNAVNNMIESKLEGVDFVVANTDAQALKHSLCQNRVQLGTGLGAGAVADVGRQAAEDSAEDIRKCLEGANMAFITAGMGGGTGTGAAPVVARVAKEMGILTIGVVTKPFHFEGGHRMRSAEKGIEALEGNVDTMIMIPNQNLFRVCDANTTFADAFKMADSVLHSGVRSVTDLIVMPGLINLDFADIRSVMRDMGKAMMGMGEASGEERATKAAQAAITNPLLDDVSMQGAQGVLINITGGMDMTLFEVDEVANRIREEVDPDAQIIFGSAFDEKLEGTLRVSVVATGFDRETHQRRRKAAEEQAAQMKRANAAPNPFTVIAGDSAAMSEPESETPTEEKPADDLTPDWLKPVADAPVEEEAPANALASLSSGELEDEPEEEPAAETQAEVEAEEVTEDEPLVEETMVQATAAQEADAENGEADSEVSAAVAFAEPETEEAAASEDRDLAEDVADWLNSASVDSQPAKEETSLQSETASAETASSGDSDDLVASLSKIFSEQGGAPKSASQAQNGQEASNAKNGVDVSSIFLDPVDETVSDEAVKAEDAAAQASEVVSEDDSGEDAGQEMGESEGANSGVETLRPAVASSEPAVNGEEAETAEAAGSDDVAIEDDEEDEGEEETPERAVGFFSGLRRGFGKPSRDEQTGKAVLERLRGCQRLNTGEA